MNYSKTHTNSKQLCISLVLKSTENHDKRQKQRSAAMVLCWARLLHTISSSHNKRSRTIFSAVARVNSISNDIICFARLVKCNSRHIAGITDLISHISGRWHWTKNVQKFQTVVWLFFLYVGIKFIISEIYIWKIYSNLMMMFFTTMHIHLLDDLRW